MSIELNKVCGPASFITLTARIAVVMASSVVYRCVRFRESVRRILTAFQDSNTGRDPRAPAPVPEGNSSVTGGMGEWKMAVIESVAGVRPNSKKCWFSPIRAGILDLV